MKYICKRYNLRTRPNAQPLKPQDLLSWQLGRHRLTHISILINFCSDILIFFSRLFLYWLDCLIVKNCLLLSLDIPGLVHVGTLWYNIINTIVSMPVCIYTHVIMQYITKCIACSDSVSCVQNSLLTNKNLCSNCVVRIHQFS